MQIDQIIVIVVAVLLAGGVIVWGIVSVRTEKDIIEERLSNYEKEATSFLDLEELKDEPQVQEKRPSII